MNEKKLEILRQLHDEVKEHPFWKTMDINFHADCVDRLKGLLSQFISSVYITDRPKCPHITLMYPTMHNLFSTILKAKIMYRQMHMNITESLAFGNYIMCLQTALQIVHCYIDGIFDENEIVMYEPYLHYDKNNNTYDKCIYKTYGVRKNDDDTYRVVRIITKDEIPSLIELNESMAKDYAETAIRYAKKERPSKFDVSYAKSCLTNAEYFKSCAEDLKNNKEKHFVIK